MTTILGISAFYHDSAACLVIGTDIAAAAQEERFTRKKHDQAFPSNSISFCLEKARISISDIDLIAFYEKPFLKFERILETYLHYAPFGIKSFLKSMPIWVRKKIWIKSLIMENLGYSGKIIFPQHHESHAASAFFPSPFDEAAFITIDGVGEWSTTSFGIGKGNFIQLLADIQFPHSLGLLYSAFTFYTGFKVNSGEYKVMGLAPYGEPKYKNLIYDHLIDVKEDGSYKLNMSYFNYCAGLTMTNSKFDKIFGGPRRKSESSLSQKDMDLARSIQEVTEEVVVKMAKHVRKETGMRNLTLAGGVTLNCVANGKLLREKIFDDIWIQPSAGDAGGALGCALFASYQYFGNQRKINKKTDSMKGSYLGPEFNKDTIKKFLDEKGYSYEELSDLDIPDKISDLIADNKVVGWFQGRMEFGPRALGARSILGDARSADMQIKMNMKIKYRESFRPFAPSVRKEDISNYFSIDRDSPYMLFVASVKKNKQIKMSDEENAYFGLEKLNLVRSEIPAVTHVDYTARIQSVDKETNNIYHCLLTSLKEKYGVSVVVNTSFNVRGEPIVCTPNDAYTCFMRTEMDYLILGNYLLNKNNQKPLREKKDWKNEFELD